jgi:putative oxidoreductase
MTDYSLSNHAGLARNRTTTIATPTTGSAANGALFLRLVLVAYWLIHWWFKVGFKGMPATETFFMANGLPAWLAWFDTSIELVFAMLLLTGFFYRFATIASLPILIASIIIYGHQGFYFPTGGIEMPLFWGLIQIVACLIGPGALSAHSPLTQRRGLIGWWSL